MIVYTIADQFKWTLEYIYKITFYEALALTKTRRILSDYNEKYTKIIRDRDKARQKYGNRRHNQSGSNRSRGRRR